MRDERGQYCENEEVEKSQVILAAQDMVDSIQKMYEDVNDMLVKELPALADSVESEIGVNEGSSFNEAATAALTSLNAALQEAQVSLKGALGGLTGQGDADAFAMGAPEMDADLGAEVGADLGVDMEAPEEEPGAELPPLPDMDDDEEKLELDIKPYVMLTKFMEMKIDSLKDDKIE